MNNFDLGGQYLQVGRCITPPEALTYIVPTAQSVLPTAAAMAAAAVTAQVQAAEVVGSVSNFYFNYCFILSAFYIFLTNIFLEAHAQRPIGNHRR